MPSDETPEMSLVRDCQARYHPNIETCVSYISGYRLSMTIHEAVRSTLERVGYESLTGEAVKEGFDKIHNFETGLSGPISFDDHPNDRTSVETYRMLTWDVDNGRERFITDWFKGISLRDLGYIE